MTTSAKQNKLCHDSTTPAGCSAPGCPRLHPLDAAAAQAEFAKKKTLAVCKFFGFGSCSAEARTGKPCTGLHVYVAAALLSPAASATPPAKAGRPPARPRGGRHAPPLRARGAPDLPALARAPVADLNVLRKLFASAATAEEGLRVAAAAVPVLDAQRAAARAIVLDHAERLRELRASFEASLAGLGLSAASSSDSAGSDDGDAEGEDVEGAEGAEGAE